MHVGRELDRPWRPALTWRWGRPDQRLAMDKRYQVMRAVLNKGLHVICYEDKFYTLPDEVRHRGPWQVLSRGEIEKLRDEYR
jgi:hypothetical protein